MRVKLATGFLVLVSLISIYQPLDPKLLRVSPENEDLIVLDRARCISNDLPQGVQQFGSLPPVDLIIHDEASAFHTGKQMRRLFFMRQVVTPNLVANKPEGDWVIGYFEDHTSGQQYLQNQPYRVVKDCENGVFLLKRP